MESLRIERKDIYTIEVNDKGETIEFDLLDIELPFKADRSFREVTRIENELRSKLVIIEKKQDHPIKGAAMTANEEARLNAYRQAFIDMRVAMDAFLGEGACQKIFGDRNYLEMYTELAEALAPHMEKMQLNSEGIRKRIKDKYGKQDDGVLR
jgi:hypothetical protein